MVKLPFMPDYFPVVLLPLYWVFWLCFYIGYLPVYLLVLLFSPYRNEKALYAFYERKASKAKRDLHYSSPDVSSDADGGSKEADGGVSSDVEGK
jgi:hypothetical protein